MDTYTSGVPLKSQTTAQGGNIANPDPYKAQNELQSFFYGNAYPGDEKRAQAMAAKVRFDLKPFLEFIKKSIERLQKASKVSAQCIEVKRRTILRPLFTLLRIKASDSVTISLPAGNIYVLEWDDDWGDSDSFDALCKGRRSIIESDAVLDVYNGKLLFETEAEIDTTAEYSVFLQNDDNAKKASVKRLDYSRVTDYRIESGNAVFSSAFLANGELTLQYSGAIDKNIVLFDKLTVPARKGNAISLRRALLSMMGDIKVEPWREEEGLVVAFCDDKEAKALLLDGVEVAYDILDKEEICHLLQDPRVIYKDKKIEAADKTLSSQEGSVCIAGLDFELTDPLGKLKHRFGANSVYVELLEDSSFADDLYSNTSHFFKESTEFVVDEEGRRYQIGFRSEKFNQIEIVLLDGKKPVKMETVPSLLYAEPNTRQLQMQRRAIEALMRKPCAEHTPLLELMQEKGRAAWRQVSYTSEAQKITQWYKLTNPNYDGCESQREFVVKALATPDFAILEGPPGSGKTTTILEIIAQMVMRGQKVMLAASTNAAIDNILERLTDLPREVQDKILAVRLGTDGAVSESVQNYTLFDIKDKDIKNEIISRANLVCGTIIGVLQHPEFELNNANKPAVPIFDCLIVDEASKTTFQEFLVPAIFAKKWILSGDLRQLTPYIEQDSIESSLAQIPEFNESAQQAQSILMALENGVFFKKENKHFRFCIPVDRNTLRAVPPMLENYPYRRIAMIGNAKHEHALTAEEFLNGSPKSVLVYGCDVLFCERKELHKVEAYLPSDFITLLTDKMSLAHYQSDGFYSSLDTKMANSKVKTAAQVREVLNEEMRKKTWAGEIAWRLCRIQELFLLSELGDGSDTQRKRYREDIDKRIPAYAKEPIQNTIALLTEIALPSVIQILQRGVLDRSVVTNRNLTTLNSGFDPVTLKQRHTLVEYQHRMHDEISAFSAKHIYEGKALKNGHIIKRDWLYDRYRHRACWLEVASGKDCSNQNPKEVEQIVLEIQAFLKYAKAHPKTNGEPWSIACLTYYRKQEDELKKAIRKLLSSERASSYQQSAEHNVEVMIYTVDKFQGKEADLVFLSMIKSGSVPLGFMDSPNRLNVALTRAKFQMVVVGCREYFSTCKSELLKAVAQEYK